MATASELEWVWLSLCLCSAAVSVATQPSGTGHLKSDLQRNAMRLSPPISGLMVPMTLLRLLSWMVLNTGDFEFCLHLMARFHFGYLDEPPRPSSAAKSNPKYTTARWAFFIAVAVPQYVRLLLWSDATWTKIWTICLLSLFLLNEFLRPYAVWTASPILFHTEWPAKPLANLSAPSSPDRDRMLLDGPFMFLKPPKPLNACEPMKRFASTLPNLPLNEVEEMGMKPCRRLSFADWSTFLHAIDNEGFIWTCGHVRCLLYKILCVPACYGIWVQYGTAFGLFGWLVHSSLRSLTICACEWLLSFRGAYSFLVVARRVFCLWTPATVTVTLVSLVCNVGKKYAIFRTWNLTAPFQFFGTNLRRTPLYFILVPVVLIYGGGFRASLQNPEPTATFYAWFLYVPALINAIMLNIFLTDRIAPRKSLPQAASGQESSEKKPETQDEKGLNGPSLDSQGASTREDVPWLGCFFLILSVPCALYWYAIGSQPKSGGMEPFSGSRASW